MTKFKMRILFLGDVVGQAGCNAIKQNLSSIIKEEKIDLLVNLNIGKKEFTSYTMDLTKKYIEINSDYRT